MPLTEAVNLLAFSDCHLPCIMSSASFEAQIAAQTTVYQKLQLGQWTAPLRRPLEASTSLEGWPPAIRPG